MKLGFFLSAVLVLSVSAFPQETPPEVQRDAAKSLVLATAVSLGSSLEKKSEAVIQAAFQRLGFGVRIVYRNPKRSLLEANAGTVDGEALRAEIAIDPKEYPNLVLVREPIIVEKYVAYALSPDIKVNGWQSLRGTDFTIAYARGSKLAEVNLPKYAAARQLITTVDFQQNLKLLINGRVDLIVMIQSQLDELLHTDGTFNGMKIYKAGSLQDLKIYTSLNKRHAELAPRLAAVLRQMKRDGTYQRLLAAVEQKLRGNREQ